ncbi:hypothetical protein ACFFGH_02025 [Lysobacter korlensis]|uniref:Transmembrane protein n=1 Tax=Lysobacter korlensis TaxID=553636 RepID=A0ABV6RI14_9GAMM
MHPIPSPATARAEAASDAVDPRLDELLRGAVAVGLALVLLLPAARGTHAVIGWLPLWLLVMPASAWWALHRFRLPRPQASRAVPAPATRSPRRAPVQARRRARVATAARMPHAA